MQRIADPLVFKERLKEARNDKDWLLKELASEAHIDLSTLKLYSSGIRVPGTDNLKKLATALNVSPEWLAGKSIFKTRSEERFARFNTPENAAASKSIKLIYQAIEELAAVHGYDLGIDPDIEVDGGLGYDGKGIALWLAAKFEHELENQCGIHLKKKEIPHPE